MEATRHISVMPREVLSFLAPERGGEYLDCTLGGAGHSRAILEVSKQIRLTACDRDQRAIERAKALLAPYADRMELQHASFADLSHVLEGRQFDGILADLGLSTDQLKENRGFSFDDNSPLDMRMDESQTVSAEQLVNEVPEKELYVCLRRGGVGPEALNVAKALVDARPVSTTRELARIVNQTMAKFAKAKTAGKKTNPATVVFQALRMAVNQELVQLEQLLDFMPQVVRKGTRVVVLTFHSLEDKAVTRRMRTWESGGEFSAQWPGARAGKRLGRMLARKAVVPGEEEVARNSSARSARLRAFEFC